MINREVLGPPPIFRPPVLDMSSYKPPLEGRIEGDFLLLDFNERTRPPHSLVVRGMKGELASNTLQVYPEYGDLDKVIADYVGVRADQIIPTNGSDQAIDIIYRALVQKVLNLESLSNGLQEKMRDFINSLSDGERWELEGNYVIKPAPTFAMLDQSAHLQGASFIRPRYKGPDLRFPFTEVMRAIRPGIKLIEICNPNNPTGTPVPKEQTEAIIKKAAQNGAAVMVDEAYHEFAPGLTVVDLIDRYGNLFITRSFSKTMGIARLRAGCVISQGQNIEQLKKVRGPYDVNSGAVGAMRALRHPAVRQDIRNYVAEVMGVSKPMIEEFYRANKVRHFPSAAGFYLLEASGLYDFLRNRDGVQILVRPRSDPPGTVRVSIGTKEDTQRYIEAFEEYLDVTKK